MDNNSDLRKLAEEMVSEQIKQIEGINSESVVANLMLSFHAAATARPSVKEGGRVKESSEMFKELEKTWVYPFKKWLSLRLPVLKEQRDKAKIDSENYDFNGQHRLSYREQYNRLSAMIEELELAEKHVRGASENGMRVESRELPTVDDEDLKSHSLLFNYWYRHENIRDFTTHEEAYNYWFENKFIPQFRPK